MNQSPVNWFDLLVLITIMLGIRQGRKNGMSVEMMITIQWIAIVAIGAALYRPLGDFLALSSPITHLWSYIITYVVLAIVVKGIFALLKKSVGGKMAGSDVFGRGEFYLGMCAGAVRFLCMLLFGLALLNAPMYSAQQVAANRAYQIQNFDSQFFPGLADVQMQVFKESCLGSLLKKQAEFVLIASTKPEAPKGVERRKDAGY
jgi:uncharacterized membrane protein required for colicin V production